PAVRCSFSRRRLSIRAPAVRQSLGGSRMKYMLLIYDDEQVWAKMGGTEQQNLFGEYMGFTDSIRKSGHYVSGAPLQPIATATSVRIRSDRQLVTDGPFAEPQEQPGGDYL